MFIKEITITCADKDSNGTITSLGFRINYLEHQPETHVNSKAEFITKYKKWDYLIKTSSGKNINVVNGKYLRTDGDNSKENDLVDLPACR